MGHPVCSVFTLTNPILLDFSVWSEPAVLWKTFSCCGFSSASPGTACTDVAPVPGFEENGRGGLVWAVHVVHICFDNDMIITTIMM